MPSRAIADRLERGAGASPASRSGAVPRGGVGVRDGWLVDALDGASGRCSTCARSSACAGAHNHQNAAVAYAAARALGLSPERGRPRLPDLRGPAAPAGGGGESAAGSASSTTARRPTPTRPRSALESFDAIFWIAGGKPKPGGFASLRPQMRAVRRAFLIGEAADEIERDLGDLAPVERSGTLAVAIEAAARAARASGIGESVVLLVPACASYDQFANFEERGDRFRELARTLAAGAAA